MNADVEQKVLDELRKVIAEAEELLKDGGDRAGDRFQALRDHFQDSVDRARRTISDAEDAIADGAKRAARAADGYVRENPWQSVGIAGAVGVLIGMLIARR